MRPHRRLRRGRGRQPPAGHAAADLIAANYFEVVAAPDFEEGVLEKLAARKNLRIFKLPALARLGELAGVPFLDVKSMADGGIILQQSFVNRIRSAADFIPAVATTKDGLTVSARKPTPQEADDLVFAWAVEAGVTSNSVIFAHNGATVAIGTGRAGSRGLRGIGHLQGVHQIRGHAGLYPATA